MLRSWRLRAQKEKALVVARPCADGVPALRWGMVGFMALRDDAADWTRWGIVGAILTMACAFLLGSCDHQRRARLVSFLPNSVALSLLSGKSASQASPVG